MNRAGHLEPTPPECAEAVEMFNHFCSAGTMKQILTLHREICNILNLKPNRLPDFYPKLKAKLASSWKAQALFKKFDVRANHKVYGKGTACSQNKVLIIGAGPCGMRAAIECQLLGAKVVVIEKRDRITRNNVLHLWPFVIHDLRALGAKKFFGKFCAGSIDHISIRQLQCILLKVSLLLGVEFHEGVSFEQLLQPTVTKNLETLGWRAQVTPSDHPVTQYEFDVLIGADGKRNTLPGFKRKEFRGKLAIAITANFINRHTEQEASVPEISGVAFIFNQKFFKDLYEETGIDLENIVYYKDDTHYFVMTAKKHSLLDKGVLLNDYADVSGLLSVENVDRDALKRYAQEAARFSTEGRLPLRDFALNHYGEADVTLFDFTSMYAAENASLVCQRHGRRLLCQLVGDSLLEPFWPTGSGCARGFLSALDSAWMVRTWGSSPSSHPLEIIAERESIYRLLAQTTPQNLQRNFGAYTLDPVTRYPNLNRTAVTPHRVTSFYDSDEPLPLDAPVAKKRRRESEISEAALIKWVGHSEPGLGAATGPVALFNLLKRYRPDLLPVESSLKIVYNILQEKFGIPPIPDGSTHDIPEAKLKSYLLRVYHAFKGEVPHIFHKSEMFNQIKQTQQLEKSLRNRIDNSISAYSNAAEADKSHSSYKKKRRSLRTQQGEGSVVGGGGPNLGGGVLVARLAAELSNTGTSITPSAKPSSSKPKDLLRSVGKIERDDWNVKEIERKIFENKLGRPEPKLAEKVPKWDREQFLGRQRRLKEGDGNEEKWGEIDETLHKLDQKLNDSGRPVLGSQKVASLATRFVKKEEPKREAVKMKEKKRWSGPSSSGLQCAACGKRVFAAEGVTADGLRLHRACFRCAVCKAVLRPGSYTMERFGSRLVCIRHSGVSVLDATSKKVPAIRIETVMSTPERISLELSDGGAREIDEDEWTDRNFLASETSGAGGLSEDEDSNSDAYTDVEDSRNEEHNFRDVQIAGNSSPSAFYVDMYFSDDSYGYDDYSEDGAESSGNESCSRMRAAREARRKEVPAEARPPTDSSEVESEEESESNDEVSSATEVSTDSEFAREECTPACPISPPAILVTEAPPPAPPALPVTSEYPLSRTRSAGGLATKRALELKRKYLLGEPSPPTVRKSDSTSQLDTKLEAFRSTITEFQKLLNPTPTQPQNPVVTFQLAEETKIQPMPDIIKNLCSDAPVDLLTKGDAPLCKSDWREPIKEEKKEIDIESDSLSEDDSSHTETMPNQSVPRVEVHDEGGELIQLDSLTIVNSDAEGNNEKETITASGPTVVALDSESTESCRDATTMALTETELSDWAVESAVLDDCGFDDKEDKKRNKNPRSLSGPKLVHETKNISTIASHVCGKSSPEPIVYSNALEHFEFADEGDQDPSIVNPVTHRNEGYMELIDEPYFLTNDRSMNFIERSYSDTTIKPNEVTNVEDENLNNFSDVIKFIDDQDSKTESICKDESIKTFSNAETRQSNTLDKSSTNSDRDDRKDDSLVHVSELSSVDNNYYISNLDLKGDSTSSSDTSPPLENESESKKIGNEISLEDISPPLASENSKSQINTTCNNNLSNALFANPCSMRIYAPAICRSASIQIPRAPSSPPRDLDLSFHLSSDSMSTQKPSYKLTIDKVQEIKKEREEQTEVVRRLVLERLGSSGQRSNRKCSRKNRTSVSPLSSIPPPVPPPPILPTLSTPPSLPSPVASPPPRPIPPLMSLPVASSFSDPDLTRERRRTGIIRSISNYLNRRLGPRHKDAPHSRQRVAIRSPVAASYTQEAPPVPPPPASYTPSNVTQHSHALLQAEQQAATVAELVQVSAQRDAHQALLAADLRRNGVGNEVGD